MRRRSGNPRVIILAYTLSPEFKPISCQTEERVTIDHLEVGRSDMTSVSIGQRLVPALLVQDMRATVAFYERLGFQFRCIAEEDIRG